MLLSNDWHSLQFLAWDLESRNKMITQRKGGSRPSENAIVAHEFNYLVSKQAWPCADFEQVAVIDVYIYNPCMFSAHQSSLRYADHIRARWRQNTINTGACHRRLNQ